MGYGFSMGNELKMSFIQFTSGFLMGLGKGNTGKCAGNISEFIYMARFFGFEKKAQKSGTFFLRC